MFAVIFFRLWYLQVLSGDKYLAEANNNRIREIRVTAPRGEILDRNGDVLVEQPHQPRAAGQPAEAPRATSAERRAELAPRSAERRRALAAARSGATCTSSCKSSAERAGDPAAGTSTTTSSTTCRSTRPTSPASRCSASSCAATRRARSARTCSATSARSTTQELKDPRYQRAEARRLIGQDGVEYEYDRYLRGRAGATRVQVDSLGPARRASSASFRRSPATTCS